MLFYIINFTKLVDNKAMREKIVSEKCTNTNEEWRPIVGFEGIYEVSSEGRVKRVKGGANNILKAYPNNKGYLGVDLHDCGRRWSAKIHRLVALTFIPNPMEYVEINHIDENKSNNSVSNLEWCTRSYNVHYGSGAERGIQKLKKVVCQYDFNGKLVKKWESAKFAGREVGIDSACIVRCCNGIMKTYQNHIWLYDDDPGKEEKLNTKIEWLKKDRNKSYAKKRPIARFTLKGEYVDTFPSVREAERKTGCNSSCIVTSIKKRRQSGGYLWKYQDCE